MRIRAPAAPRGHSGRSGRPAAALLLLLAAAALASPAAANKPPPPPVSDANMAAVAASAKTLARLINQAAEGGPDQAVNTVKAPALAATEQLLNRKAEVMEGPVKRLIEPAHRAGTQAVAKAVRFWEGPFADATVAARRSIGDKIVGIARSVEGDGPDNPADPNQDFIPEVAKVLGRKTLVPGSGRVVSIGVFGLIPKPPPRNASEPRRETDPVWPSDLSDDPTGAPDGVCKPWEVPEGYANVLDYCQAMRKLPKEHWAGLYNKTVPARGEPFPLTGCVFGCLVGNDTYTALQQEWATAFGWAGKCFSKERDADGVPKRFGTMLGHDYMVPTGKTQAERVSYYTGAGDYIFTGKGSYLEKSRYDGRGAWQFQDDRPRIESLMAGGWRTFHTLAQAFADGVTDEFRPLGNGVVLGKTFYTPPIFRGRVSTDTGFFLLFQACTKDGKVPWRPEQRDAPLIGAERK